MSKKKRKIHWQTRPCGRAPYITADRMKVTCKDCRDYLHKQDFSNAVSAKVYGDSLMNKCAPDVSYTGHHGRKWG